MSNAVLLSCLVSFTGDDKVRNCPPGGIGTAPSIVGYKTVKRPHNGKGGVSEKLLKAVDAINVVRNRSYALVRNENEYALSEGGLIIAEGVPNILRELNDCKRLPSQSDRWAAMGDGFDDEIQSEFSSLVYDDRGMNQGVVDMGDEMQAAFFGNIG